MSLLSTLSKGKSLLPRAIGLALFATTVSFTTVTTSHADETCMSPYMAKITGQEDFVYIWTLGVEGLGDGQDKLVTVDVNPKSDNYGKVINSLSVGGWNEAHHSGLTDDRKYLWAGGLDKIRSLFSTFTQIQQSQRFTTPLIHLYQTPVD